MKNIDELKNLSTPIVKIDKSFDKFKGTVLFFRKTYQS